MQSYRHKVRNTQEYFTNVICQSEKSEMKALQIFLTEKKKELDDTSFTHVTATLILKEKFYFLFQKRFKCRSESAVFLCQNILKYAK